MLKSTVILWRAVRSLRTCDRLSSPLSVISVQLRVRRNEMTNSCCCLLAKLKIDSVESCKKPETL